jgi:hypothetical protein
VVGSATTEMVSKRGWIDEGRGHAGRDSTVGYGLGIGGDDSGGGGGGEDIWRLVRKTGFMAVK